MKRFVLVLSVLISFSAQATNYYVSSISGNDANNGTSAATPWKSLAKVNAAFSSIAAGDSILFKSGEIFEGKLLPNRSGTAVNPIVIGAYGNGARPIITPLTNVTGWVSLGGNLWRSSAIATTVKKLDIVTINDISVAMGRYPNADAPSKGYMYFESVTGKTGITDLQLPSSPSWTGAELVLRQNSWTIGNYPITAHVGTSVTFSGNPFVIRNNHGYFIQNHVSTLDQQNEWFYDKATRQLTMFSTTAPANVKASTVDTLCYIYNRSYITIKGLEFAGANQEAISLDVTTGITIEDCYIHYSGTNAIRARASASPKVINCLLWDNYNCAISFNDSGNSNAEILNNNIARTGSVPGRGTDLNGINTTGSGHLIQGNTIESTGYVPIYFMRGSNITIRNNVIDTYCTIKSDGGGIYTWNADPVPVTYTNRKIIGNIILNGVGSMEGTAGEEPDVDGIYMDDNTGNVEILDNTVYNVAGAGMYIHNSFNMNIQRNTLYNNHRVQMNYTHNPMYVNGTLLSYSTPIRNITVKKNIFVSRDASQKVTGASSIRNDLDSMGISDSNYYARPVDDDLTFDITRTVGATVVSDDYSLTGWKLTAKKDAASKKSPMSIPKYTISGYATSNIVTNGHYTTNMSGTNLYSPNANHTVAWDNTGKINGGSLRITFPTAVKNTFTSLYTAVGAISSSKEYILRFSTLGTLDTANFRVYLRKTGAPFNTLTSLVYKRYTNSRMDHEFLFTAPTSEAAASILIDFEQTGGTVFIDNLEFYEANITPTDLDDNIKFVYNPTASNLTMGLPYKYLSVDSIEYNGTITLAPYSSKVLLKKGPISGVLPVKLLSFNANTADKKTVKTEWKTTEEVNSSHYMVQRSSNGRDFENIGKVTSNNIADRQSTYSFADMNPLQGTNYYRLMMVDKDGTAEYSKTVAVQIKAANGFAVDNIRLTTSSSMVKFTLNSSQQQEVNVALMDASGRILLNTKVAAGQGANYISRPVSGLSNGVYYLKMFNTETTLTKTVLSGE
ncbi:MAG TPA: right-handed parallel beta-helix repeat-containing protein [Ferruginibacter sp.]|nr:right-handed parallel beta-helix repeat-containing protein [Ferruginibacter sp.]HMP21137.1 right-handed parallel beta-helix repeat-containing protein [Ferruginibacter sp.]